MKYRDEQGKWQELYLPPTGDTLPIGTVVDYDGDEVPYGYEKVDDMSGDNFIKYEDGTMICWGKSKGIDGSYQTVVFPQEFSTIPICTVSGEGTITNNYFIYAQICGITTTDLKVAVYYKTRTDTSGAFGVGGNTFYWNAIGRWK